MKDGCPKTRDGWEGRYLDGNTPWDLGGPPPVLADVIASVGAEPLRVLVPGAGFGYDAIRWAQAGHDATMIDIAPSAIEGARRLALAAGVRIRILEADLFALPELDGSFDLVWEPTCFCALPPEQRGAYALQVADWLVAGGAVAALLWNHGMDGGPPYDITPAIARAAFEPHFAIESLEAVIESAPGRSDEFLVRMSRRGSG